MRTFAAVTLALLPAALASGQEAPVRLRVRNALDAARPSETVEVAASALAGRVEAADLSRLAVTDGRSGHEVLSQAVDEDGDGAFDRLLFQADFAPGEAREFVLSRAEPRKPRREDYRVYARFVRERQDDFAWENDKVAFRIYGPALETFAKEPLTSSTVDAWSKRTRRLVLNDWYLVDDYHSDHGEGGDFYSAGEVARLRRQRPDGRRGARRLEELPLLARARERPPPGRLRGLLPRVGEAGAEGDRGEARHPRRR